MSTLQPTGTMAQFWDSIYDFSSRIAYFALSKNTVLGPSGLSVTFVQISANYTIA